MRGDASVRRFALSSGTFPGHKTDARMRTLLLLRHAHAEPAAAGQADIDRPLSVEGLAEAEAAGRWLAEQGLLPDRILCSPARRTRETLEAVLSGIGYVEQRLVEEIYLATPGALAGLIDEHREVERLLLVGHNPGLERLLALMHSGQSGDYRGMPPGAVAVLQFPVDAVVEPGVASLSAFWWP
jgi:phosphohistidine phosphatase